MERLPKGERLQQWGESEDDFLHGLSSDAEPKNGILDDILTDDMQTLRLSPGPQPKQTLRSAFSRGRSPQLRDTSSRPTLSPRVFLDYAEDTDDDGFGDNFEISAQDHAKMKEWVSPATISLPSPSHRHSLSSYSEETDTDITEIDGDEFEEIDDIFGKEESGIYKSAKQQGRAGDVLNQRRQKLQKEAEVEDQELFKRYQNQSMSTVKLKHPREEVQTLKLRDLQDRDQTIDYEYTKDDFEGIEDGFLGDPSQSINAGKLQQFRTSSGLSHKMSMPTFPQSLKTFKAAKSKSTVDLNGALAREHTPKEHPLFNQNNKLIKKLDRMPSFHVDRKAGDRRAFEKEKVEARKANDKADDRKPRHITSEDMDYNMELHKKQLLEKYMEITEKQMQLRSSPKRKRVSENSRRNIGIVKFLNDQSYAPVVDNRKMRFNPSAKTWEGNEHDLLRFDEGSPKKQPGLITSEQFSQGSHKGMKYDAANLRWVNMDPLDEEAENVFRDVTDLVPNDLPVVRGLKTDRGASTFTQRTVSTNSEASTKAANAGEEFSLSRKMLARFEKEEEKIRKKTHNWFGADETYHLRPATFDSDYFWDIRKMVVDKDDN